MPDELKEWIKDSAHRNRRSMNAEIVVRLEQNKKKEEERLADGGQ